MMRTSLQTHFFRVLALSAGVVLVAACSGDVDGESAGGTTDPGGSGWTADRNEAGASQTSEESASTPRTVSDPHTVGVHRKEEASEVGAPGGTPARATPTEEAEDDPPSQMPPEGVSFVAHEWGTFTSVVSSEGTYLPGLHHQGVGLPPFVHSFRYAGPGHVPGRDFEPGVALPEQVTQKLETPVIYFYTEEPRDVRVEVDFPKGYITKWFPDAVEQRPTDPQCTRCADVDRDKHGLERLADGRMAWDVSITHRDRSSQMTDVPEDDIWAPSREVPRAAYVQHDSETDKFIFYRGLGRASLPFRIESDRTPRGPEFTFVNESEQRVPNVYLLNITEERGRITEVSSVAAGGSKTLNPAPKEMPKEAFVERAKRIVKDGLVQTGLTPTESEAMVETWAHSYFRKTGYRVLYVLPRAWTDRLLPIDIEPRPDRLVRTLVGRVEVMTPTVEQETLRRVRRAHREGESLLEAYRGGRFEEPHFRRACQLAESAELNAWCETELRKLSTEVVDEHGRSGY